MNEALRGSAAKENPAVSVLGKLIDRVLSGPDRREIVAQRLYAALTAQARRPDFYISCGVPDTIDGRFEMVALHAFLLFRRLKGHGDKAGAVAQSVYDVMFGDFDVSVREMGAQDLGQAALVIGREVEHDDECRPRVLRHLPEELLESFHAPGRCADADDYAGGVRAGVWRCGAGRVGWVHRELSPRKRTTGSVWTGCGLAAKKT